MFEITRADGRSHQQVLIDAVHNAPPDTMYTYEELNTILGFYKKERTRAVVIASQHRLLAEFSRTMENVRGKGYRVVEASEHMRLANGKKRRADTQMKKGLHILRHVKWDELSEEARNAHMGTLMITEALYQQQVAQDKRLARIEEAIHRARLE